LFFLLLLLLFLLHLLLLQQEPQANMGTTDSDSKEALGLKSKKATVASSDKEAGSKGSKADVKAPAKKEAAPVAAKPAAASTSAPVVKPPAVAARPAVAAGRGGDGIADDVLTQIAQAKFESQEDKLRDVARHSMALLRDFPKLEATDCDRKIADIRKVLLKYEMQYIRSWEFQEKRRRQEIEALEAETQRFRQEAEEEGAKLVELRQVLEKERRRRKRYEGYEEAAAEVNKKKTKVDSKAEIQGSTDEIARLQTQQRELEALTEERNQRAQKLRNAVEELKRDLQREHELRKEVLGEAEVGAAQASTGEAAAAAAAASADLVEVVS